MDTTVLLAAGAIAAVLVLVAGVAATRSGKFAVAGPGRWERSSRVGAPISAAAATAVPVAPSAPPRPSPLAASPALDFPAAPESSLASPFAPAAPPQAELAIERLQARMDARFDALERDLRARLDAIVRDVAAGREASGGALAAIESKQSVMLRDIRADLAPLLNRAAGIDPLPISRERRAEASAELYALLSRLESAISQVTNPVLLPGEAYAPPPEFFAEALAWENWKEVGERAFVLAETFSARRLFLSDQAVSAVTGFITTLRGVLTRSVYPNLMPDATPDQIETLRSAMAALAAELPKVRRVLEQEFRSAVAAPASSP